MKSIGPIKAATIYDYVSPALDYMNLTRCFSCRCVSPLLRGEAQAKSGKKEQTQGHMRKKIVDMQRQIKQTAKDTTRWETNVEIWIVIVN